MLPLEPCLCPSYLINFSLSSTSDKSAPPGTMPLSSTSNKYLPLYHQWKMVSFHPGLLPLTELSSYGASSCTYKTYKRSIQKTFICFGVEITPSLWQRYSKASRGSGFVNMYVICSFVPTYSTLMFFSATCSRRK
jgi:hypothetical protein